MIKSTCIKKNKDSKGNTISYILQDQQGQKRTATSKEIKAAIKTGELAVNNLQIDKAGRLVDKAIDKNILKQQAIDKAKQRVNPYQHAYREYMEFRKMLLNKYVNTLMNDEVLNLEYSYREDYAEEDCSKDGFYYESICGASGDEIRKLEKNINVIVKRIHEQVSTWDERVKKIKRIFKLGSSQASEVTDFAEVVDSIIDEALKIVIDHGKRIYAIQYKSPYDIFNCMTGNLAFGYAMASYCTDYRKLTINKHVLAEIDTYMAYENDDKPVTVEELCKNLKKGIDCYGERVDGSVWGISMGLFKVCDEKGNIQSIELDYVNNREDNPI